MTITELSIKRPSLILVIFLALALTGVFGYFQLRYELVPKMNIPFATIMTVYPGASPGEVENGVTKKIEDAVSSAEKIVNIFSTSYEGLSLVTIEFSSTANIDVALQDVQRKVNAALVSFPRDVRPPMVQKFSFDEMPIITMGVTSSMASRDFYQFLKDQIQPRLSKLDGVGQVSLIGGDIREIKINLDAQKVRAYGLSIAQITQIVRASNLDFPTGAIKGEKAQSIVRVSGKFSKIDDLRDLIVSRSRQGGGVKLKDIAEVEDGIQEYKSISRINGKNSVGITLLKQSDANTVEVSRLVRNEVRQLETQYRQAGLRFDIASDRSEFTIEAANAVKEDLLMAVLLVAGVMFLFLHDLRNSVIVLISIPASLIASILAMWAFDFSLNLMTLLALSLVIGILVDDSIVVLENIHHHLENGQARFTAAIQGRNEIGFAALSITLVDVVVFVPLAMVGGVVGGIMREFAIVIVISTLMSLFVSFTLTPMLASRFSRVERASANTLAGRIALWFEDAFRRLTERYIKLLNSSLTNAGKVILGMALLFMASLLLPALGLIGSEFMKQSDQGQFIVKLELPPGSTLENTNRTAQQVEGIVAAFPEVKKIFTSVGLSSQGINTSNNAELMVTLVDRKERSRATSELANEIKRRTRQIPGIKVYIDEISITGQAGGAPIWIFVTGNDPDSLEATSNIVRDALRKTPTVIEVKSSTEMGNPETKIEVDRQKMSTFGLTVYDVGSTLRVALTGDDESMFRQGQYEYPIRVALDKFDRSDPDDIARLPFMSPMGRQIELQQFCDIAQSSGPTKLERKNRNSSISIFGYIDNAMPLGSVVQEYQKIIGNRKAGGTTVELSGQEKDRADSFGLLGFALLASILFVYFIMVGLYDSFIYPFVVMFAVPLAIIGALVVLALTGNALSIFSILGIIMMIGLVTKNAILLVDRTNDNREKGLSVHDALVEAGRARIRPIFMTTLSMVFGMLPIALAKGAGAEWKNGLGWALVGGLLSSMFLTLVVVPAVYTKIEKMRVSIPALFRRPFAVQRLKRMKALAGGTTLGQIHKDETR
jgi:hydrophobic/amphiphilic exporter-1 (mainly G- bacteria), HAE1 family